MAMRRVHSREFKLEAVRLVSERGVSVAQAARDLGLQNIGSASARIRHKFAAQLPFFRATLCFDTDYGETLEKT
jgi:hypothetical protein